MIGTRAPFLVTSATGRSAMVLVGEPGTGKSSVARAVYPGRVAFADEYADYGKTVIVDHGGGYFTVSGNLAAVEVKVGDDLRAGEPLGRTGATPRGYGFRSKSLGVTPSMEATQVLSTR